MINLHDENSEASRLIQWLFQPKEENTYFSEDLINHHHVINFVPFSYQLQATKNEQQQISLLITNAFFSINKLFEENNIPLIHLKGPSLSYRLYKNFTKPFYFDLYPLNH